MEEVKKAVKASRSEIRRAVASTQDAERACGAIIQACNNTHASLSMCLADIEHTAKDVHTLEKRYEKLKSKVQFWKSLAISFVAVSLVLCFAVVRRKR